MTSVIHGLLAAAGVAAMTAAAGEAQAQAFPSRPIEIVVHTTPGGGSDVVARIVAEILTREKLVTQPVNVSNRPGGGGAVAYSYIKSKHGDPHVIMAVASMALLTQTLRPELGLGLETYTPLAFMAQDPQAILVAADARHRTLKELLDTGRREPNTLTVSITSAGGTGRMLAWMMERESGARFRPVVFKSGADALLQVMGGHTTFSTENISEGYAAVESRKLRVLAVSSAQRLPIVPDAPTLRETGLDIHVGTGRGFAMPAGVPKEAADQMEKILARVYASPAWKEHAARNMYENIWMSGAEYGRHLAERKALVTDFLQAVGAVPK